MHIITQLGSFQFDFSIREIVSEALISYIGLSLTVIALALAMYQGFESKRQTKRLSEIVDESAEQNDKIVEIGQSLSTRYIDSFPQYFGDVANLIRRANSELTVICTFPCNGIYSDPNAWLSIKLAIEEFLGPGRNTKANFVFSNRKIRNEYLHEQFSEASSNWFEWSLEDRNKDKISNFFQRLGDEENIEAFSRVKDRDYSNDSRDDFFELLDKSAMRDLGLFKNLVRFGRGEVIEIDIRPKIYIWIIDRKEAIFSIPGTSRGYEAHAFSTVDARLLRAFTNIHEGYKREN